MKQIPEVSHASQAMLLLNLPIDILESIPLSPSACLMMVNVCKLTKRIYWPFLSDSRETILRDLVQFNSLELYRYGQDMKLVNNIGVACLYAAECNADHIVRTYRGGPVSQISEIRKQVAKQGNFELLDWLKISLAGRKTGKLYYTAAKAGHSGVIEWSSQEPGNCPQAFEIALGAARGGHLELLQRIDAACGGIDVAINIAERSAIDIAAVKGGNLNVVKYLQSDSINMVPILISYAVKCGRLNILKWLHERPGTFPIVPLQYRKLFTSAIKHGHLHLLKYLHEIGHQSLASDLVQAIDLGHLDIIRWLHETFNYPIVNLGEKWYLKPRLDLLQYFASGRSEGIKWHDPDILYVAAMDGHADVFLWAKQHGCPLKDDVKLLLDNVYTKHLEASTAIVLDRCPWAMNKPLVTKYTPIIQWLQQYLAQENETDTSSEGTARVPRDAGRGITNDTVAPLDR